MAKYNVAADFKAIGRIMDGTKVCGYIVKDRKGKQRVLKKDVFEQLALMKHIYNCNAQEYNGAVNLRGIGMKLTELPKFSIHGERIVPEFNIQKKG